MKKVITISGAVLLALYSTQIVFATLKLGAIIAWSWWLVCLPILVLGLLALIFAMFFGPLLIIWMQRP